MKSIIVRNKNKLSVNNHYWLTTHAPAAVAVVAKFVGFDKLVLFNLARLLSLMTCSMDRVKFLIALFNWS